MFSNIATSVSPTPKLEDETDGESEQRRTRRLLLNRKRMAKQKLDAMMNLNRPLRKGLEEEVNFSEGKMISYHYTKSRNVHHIPEK